MKLCPFPFSRLEMGFARIFVPCCTSWLSPEYISFSNQDRIENDYSQDPYLWNSKSAQALRQSILDGSFKYCLRDKCKMQLSEENEILQANPDCFETPIHKEVMEEIKKGHVAIAGPTSISLAADRSCNLACPSCRDRRMVRPLKPEQEFVDREIAYVHRCAKTVQVVKMANSGEVFFSDQQKKLLKSFNREDYPRLQFISVVTNGTLAGERMFASLKPGSDYIKKISISMDASCEDTYKKTRGGRWKTLMKNLEWISAKRSEGRFVWVSLLFVVRRQNFRDIPGFIELAENFKFDRCQFIELDNWKENYRVDTGISDYAAEAVHLPGHPLYSELAGILEKYKNHPLAQINIRGF